MTPPEVSGTIRSVYDLMDRGFAVIPVPHRHKAPRLKGWQSLRISRDEVSARFANDPGNIGILLGEPSGMIIDVDLDDYLAVELAEEFLPPTAAVFGRESRPRSHRLYRVADSTKTQKWPGKDGMLVELRSTGCQTIGPGSVHPSGEAVRWDEDGEPAAVEPAVLIESIERLVAMIKQRRGETVPAPVESNGSGSSPATHAARAEAIGGSPESLARCRRYVAEQCRDSVEGRRGDDALYRVACVTVEFGLGDAAAMEVLEEFNATRCSPPWPLDRLRHKLAEANKNADRGKRGREPEAEYDWPDPEPLDLSGRPPELDIEALFPAELAKIGTYIRSVSDSLQVPAELPCLLMLPAVSLAISGSAEVEVAPDWREVPPIWTLCMLPSGERKSPVFRRVLQPIWDWESETCDDLAPIIAKAKEEQNIKAQRLLILRKQAAAEESGSWQDALDFAADMEATVIPSSPRLVTSEPTPEAVADLLARNGGRLLLAAPEADAFDTMMGRYQRGVPNLGVFLLSHAGDPIAIDRKNGGSIKLACPLLSVALTVQPEAVRDLLQNRQANGRGLIARFVLSCPTSRLGSRELHPDPVDIQLESTWAAWLSSLLELPKLERPVVVGFSPEAHHAMSDFRQWIEDRIGRGGELEDQCEFANKLPGLVARVALSLFALGHWGRAVSPASDDKIEEHLMLAAVHFGRWAMETRSHALQTVGADPDLVRAKKIADWIVANGMRSFSKRDAFTAKRSGLITEATDLDVPIRILSESGWIRRVAKKPGRGRPSERYDVNPRVHQSVPAPDQDETPGASR